METVKGQCSVNIGWHEPTLAQTVGCAWGVREAQGWLRCGIPGGQAQRDVCGHCKWMAPRVMALWYEVDRASRP